MEGTLLSLAYLGRQVAKQMAVPPGGRAEEHVSH